jgi:inorganic pyrophosphatase
VEFDVVVEIPAGSRNKYEMDRRTGRIRLDRMLFTSTAYPADYGFVNHTLGGDGGPLDVLVVLDEPTFPGCLIRCRTIGMFVMSDEQGPDEKVLCVPARDPRRQGIQDIGDVPLYQLNEIAHFFEVYKDLERGKSVDGSHWEGRDAAEKEIVAAYERRDAALGDWPFEGR